MNRDSLKQKFRRHVGDDVFRRFVVQLRRDTNYDSNRFGRSVNRLRHWQESKWIDFIYKHPELSISEDINAIRESLLWCDIHERYLTNGEAVRDRVGVTDRDGNCLDPEFDDALNERFPYGFGFWTLICPDCVAECEAWMTFKESTTS